MEPEDYFGGTPGGGLAVSRTDPPLTSPGMTYIELDSEGRLVSFDAVLPDERAAGQSSPAPDWPALFKEAGLDMTAFTSVEPTWTSRAESDAASAWTGPGADDTGAELRVEAAAFQGRPVFFRLIGPWTKPRALAPAASTMGTGEQVMQYVLIGIIFLVPIAAIGLALRNLRLGRTDTRGATRLAATIGGVVALGAALGSSPGPGLAWLTASFMLASWAGFSALLIATFYLAVEPYVRRHWPRMLISWSRLLDGQWRDPLVGRDLLVGAVIAVVLGATNWAHQILLAMRGVPPPVPTLGRSGWMGPRDAVAELLAVLPEMLWITLGIVVLLVLLRMVLRRELVATLSVAAIFVAAATAGAKDPLVDVWFALAAALAFVLIPTRFGLVMFATFMLVGQSGDLTDGLATPEFATHALVLGMVAMLAPGVFGFYTATRGRRASAWLDG
jgi:serine/threonine-protein kinase